MLGENTQPKAGKPVNSRSEINLLKEKEILGEAQCGRGQGREGFQENNQGAHPANGFSKRDPYEVLGAAGGHQSMIPRMPEGDWPKNTMRKS